VTGCCGHLIVAHINHHVYTAEHPAFTYPLEQKLREHKDLAYKVKVHHTGTRCSHDNQDEPMLFNRKTTNGQDVDHSQPGVKLPLQQCCFVCILPQSVKNDAATRRVWATNLAVLFQNFTKNEAEFYEDRTPSSGPNSVHLYDIIIKVHAMKIAEDLYKARSSEILEDDDAMNTIFGAEHVEHVRRSYVNNFISPTRQNETEQDEDLLNNLPLHPLPGDD